MKGDHLSRGGKSTVAPRVVAFFSIFMLGSAVGFLYCSMQPKQPPPDHGLFSFRSECAPPLLSSQVIPEIIRKVYAGVSPYTNFPPAHAWTILSKRGARGWGSTNPVFEEVIRQVRPKVIVEIGSFLGASALHMANVTRQLGLESTSIVCLDDFRGWVGFRRDEFSYIGEVNGDVMLMYEFMWNVVQAGEQERVLALPFSTSVGLESLCDMGVYGDVVVVDAGHDFHSAWDDINRGWMVVRAGGMMFGHDYDLPMDNFGVRRAVHLFAKLKGLDVKQNGQHWVLYPPKGP